MKRFFANLLPALVFGSIWGAIVYLTLNILFPGIPVSLVGVLIGGCVGIIIPPHVKPCDDVIEFIVIRLIFTLLLTAIIIIIAAIFGFWTWAITHVFTIMLAMLILNTAIYFCDQGWQWLNELMS